VGNRLDMPGSKKACYSDERGIYTSKGNRYGIAEIV
jgi:hypothetical protein